MWDSLTLFHRAKSYEKNVQKRKIMTQLKKAF